MWNGEVAWVFGKNNYCYFRVYDSESGKCYKKGFVCFKNG